MAWSNPSSSLWEWPECSTTVRRMLPWHLTPSGPWIIASLGLDCGGLSAMGGNSRRRTRRRRRMRAASQRRGACNAGSQRSEASAGSSCAGRARPCPTNHCSPVPARLSSKVHSGYGAMGASSEQSLSIRDLPKGYSKVCPMPCFAPVVQDWRDTTWHIHQNG